MPRALDAPRWTIYYADGSTAEGDGAEDWRAALDDGVQVVALWEAPMRRPWSDVNDRQLWTGEDAYDPFGWGTKRGSALPFETYWEIWARAAYGDR